MVKVRYSRNMERAQINQQNKLMGPCGEVDPKDYKTVLEWLGGGVIPTYQRDMEPISNPKLKKRLNHQPQDMEYDVLMKSGLAAPESSGIGCHKNSKARRSLSQQTKGGSQNSLEALSDGSRRVYAHGPPVRACHYLIVAF